nr:MAG TPA: hypothetical protein [Caudoviricetes sp.]
MKSIPNTLHADLIKFLESLPEHVTGMSVRELEFKRKATLLKKKLERCKDITHKSTANKPRPASFTN